MPTVRSRYDLVNHFFQNYETNHVLLANPNSANLHAILKHRFEDELIAEGRDKDEAYKIIEGYAQELQSMFPGFYTINEQRELKDRKEQVDPQQKEFAVFLKEIQARKNAISKSFEGLYEHLTKEQKEEFLASSHTQLDRLMASVQLKSFKKEMQEQLQNELDILLEEIEHKEYQLEFPNDDEIEQLIELHDNMELFDDMAQEHQIRDSLK